MSGLGWIQHAALRRAGKCRCPECKPLRHAIISLGILFGVVAVTVLVATFVSPWASLALCGVLPWLTKKVKFLWSTAE